MQDPWEEWCWVSWKPPLHNSNLREDNKSRAPWLLSLSLWCRRVSHSWNWRAKTLACQISLSVWEKASQKMKLWNLDMVWMISQNEKKMTGWWTGSFEQKSGSTGSSGTHKAPTHNPYPGQQAEGIVTRHYFMPPTVVTSAVQWCFFTRILVK